MEKSAQATHEGTIDYEMMDAHLSTRIHRLARIVFFVFFFTVFIRGFIITRNFRSLHFPLAPISDDNVKEDLSPINSTKEMPMMLTLSTQFEPR